MAVEVAKVELKSVQDASGLEERILAGQFTADQVVAVVGKTEGNGGPPAQNRVILIENSRLTEQPTMSPSRYLGCARLNLIGR